VEKTANIPHLSGAFPAGSLAKQIATMRLPVPAALEGTVLDGEMIVPLDPIAGDYGGGKSKFVTSIMGSLPEEAVLKQIERGWLRYVVFDCLFYKGRDLRDNDLHYRRGMAKQAAKEWGNPFASLADMALGSKGPSNKRRFLDEILRRGGEGIILKHIGHTYGDKQGWVKVKAEWTADVVIMGFKDAKEMSTKKGDDKATITKYAKAGLVGAIQCGQYVPYPDAKGSDVPTLTEVATVSGMDDGLRMVMTAKPKEYIGRVIEIAHNGREPTGRFRHPRFKRFRDDKSPKDCVYREGEI
jgi:ATP-dependent DNA ligase